MLFFVSFINFEVQRFGFHVSDLFISHFAAEPSAPAPAFVLYRGAAFRIALGSLSFSLFYVVLFRVVPRSFQLRCATVFLFYFQF